MNLGPYQGASTGPGGTAAVVHKPWRPNELRDLVRQVWTEFHALPPLRSYMNTEGGDVRQVGHPLSSLRHCANYAAVLKLLNGRGRNLRLLEIGCGSGALSSALAWTMPEDWRLVATDYSAALVAQVKEGFGVLYTGYIEVPIDAVYTFYLTSDDGSRLYIGEAGETVYSSTSKSLPLAAWMAPTSDVSHQQPTMSTDSGVPTWSLSIMTTRAIASPKSVSTDRFTALAASCRAYDPDGAIA